MLRSMTMIIAAIIYIGVAGRICGNIVGVTAAKLPSQSGSPPESLSRVRNGNANYRSNPDDDIPIVGGDHFRDRSKRGDGRSGLGMFGRRSKRSLRRRSSRRNLEDDIAIDDDGNDALDDEPHPFFFEQDDFNDDGDGWPRRHKRRKSKINHHHHHHPFDSFRYWALETTGVHIPRINLHLDPITILKIRKSWHNIIPGAIIRAGADIESHGVWRVRGCVEDKLVGGRLTIKNMKHGGNENDDDRTFVMEYSKSWLLSGAGTTGTRFNLCATYDMTAQRGSARLGFRSETTDVAGRYQLITGRKGFSIVPLIPLDRDRRLFLEAKACIDLPQPEFVIGTNYFGRGAFGDGQSVGMGIGGEIDVDLNEVNFIVSL